MASVPIPDIGPLPNRELIDRFESTPQQGPRILFFSGGTALRSLSRRLINYTHNSVHIITPFDSGGSSAEMRRVFRMPAVGDVRNRLLALADRSTYGNPEVIRLFACRLPKDKSQEELLGILSRLINAQIGIITEVPNLMRDLICSNLEFFFRRMPENFDLRGASIGNLVLAGGYLNDRRQLDPVIDLFSELIEARGIVRPVTGKDLHLISELENGEILVGQHLLAGKEVLPISSPVKQVYLSRQKKNPEPYAIDLSDRIRQLIASAEIICYPMGSFYSSIIANFLVAGVGDVITGRTVPKIYIPNTGTDPEELGLSLAEKVEVLVKYLRQSCSEECSVNDLLQYVLLDTETIYGSSEDLKRIEHMGIRVVTAPLVTNQSTPYLDPSLLTEVLLSFS